jgi:lipopolysaccharide transport system ATP-binding protein
MAACIGADLDIETPNMVADRKQVGIAGTFDVENYGDLLFPLIAAEALRRRDPGIAVVPFSPNARLSPPWPFEVRGLETLPDMLPDLAAMLIGGGHIVRFDATYPVPVPGDLDMPVAYWLIPAMLAALAGKPVIWNAVGALTSSPRAPRYDAVLRQTLAASRFVGVRDEPSRVWLRRFAPDAAIELLPDTAFGLARLWPLGAESPAFAAWRASLGLEGRFAIVQASPAMPGHRAAIEAQLDAAGLDQAVILPVCRCHGDDAALFPPLTAGRRFRGEWLDPLLIREIIARADLLFASSLHACITALSYGVPVVRAVGSADPKFAILDGFDGVARIGDAAALARIAGRGRQIEPRVAAHGDRLDLYWDEVADAARDPSPGAARAARRQLSDMVVKLSTDPGRLGAMTRWRARAGNFAVLARAWLALRLRPPARPAEARPAPAAPLPPILDIARLDSHRMENAPYRWALIDRIFSAGDGAALAASFPRDKYRKVAGNDGEKSYFYHARSLVHMGASAPSHPDGLSPAWRALAADLLSDDYRAAVARTTGLDLSSALMEVNVISYGPGSWLGPHVDLKEKIATHILYFNETWDARDGGCLNILRSRDPADLAAQIPPLVGNSSLLVRSDSSWHSVSPVTADSARARRSLNIIFHLPGSVSTMWPPGKRYALRPAPGA